MFSVEQFFYFVCSLGGLEQQYCFEVEEDLGCQLSVLPVAENVSLCVGFTCQVSVDHGAIAKHYRAYQGVLTRWQMRLMLMFRITLRIVIACGRPTPPVSPSWA